MKKFRFTLPALKTLRERNEQEALEAYAKAVRQQTLAETELTQAKASLDALCQERQNVLNQGISAIETVQFHTYSLRLQGLCREKESALAKAQQGVKRQWQLLLVARQKREVVDKFLQRQKARYQFELNREEQKMLDELAGKEPGGSLANNLNVNPAISS